MKSALINFKKATAKLLNSIGLYDTISKFRVKFNMYRYGCLSESDYPKTVKRWYFVRTGEQLDLDNPKTYLEKVHWLTLHDNNLLKEIVTDKYRVKKWVTDLIGEEYVIPLYDMWLNADDIDFAKLPKFYVLKANMGDGSDNMIIVNEKYKFSEKDVRKKLNYWLTINFTFAATGGWVLKLNYKNTRPCIIAERYVENMGDEYKFFCFHGEPKYVFIVQDTLSDLSASMYDLDFEPAPFSFNASQKIKQKPIKPNNFEEMIRLAKILSNPFIFVRVDLYNVNGRIYFGEISVTPIAGVLDIQPIEYNKLLGDFITLPIETN